MPCVPLVMPLGKVVVGAVVSHMPSTCGLLCILFLVVYGGCIPRQVKHLLNMIHALSLLMVVRILSGPLCAITTSMLMSCQTMVLL